MKISDPVRIESGKAKKAEMLDPVTVERAGGQSRPAEVRVTDDGLRPKLVARVETTRPLSEAIDRVWIVPEK